MENLIPAGTVDIYGLTMVNRRNIINKLEAVYQRYGFEPLSTPTIEFLSVFGGHHGEGEKIFFHLNDKNNNKLILRYDLTVPLARFISSHPEIKLPYKRFQFANSFRDDDVDHGHFREFIQCDGDIIGDGSLLADAEIVNIAHSGLKEVGFNDFTIRLNHRRLIKGIAEYACGSDCDILSIQRALDFADKTIKNGLDGVKQDLLNRGINSDSVERICYLLGITGKSSDVLNQLKEVLAGFPEAISGINELEEILSFLDDDVCYHVSIDLTLARGADYYSGFILEAVIPGIRVGAVLGGGRYDNLVSSFGGGNIPATGMAFGLDRIITALNDLGASDNVSNDIVLMAVNKNQLNNSLLVATTLRNTEINVNFNTGFDSLESAVDYAKNHNYPVVLHNLNGNELQVVKLIENDFSQKIISFFK
jgi:histidyl-tRNA synthetase